MQQGRAGAELGLGALAQTDAWARGTGAVRGHARPGRAAGPTGCALGALSLF